MGAPWRYIVYAQRDAATNMSLDEAILEAHLAGLVPPTLRLYGFAPPAVTLGYSQSVPEGLMERAQSEGFEVVRRPTGGRAVLHAEDLTYSFVGTSSECGEGFLSTSVSGAYKQICRGLQLALHKLGLDLELGNSDVSYRKLHDCFGATTGSDLHVGGKKMIGSAQLRRKHAVLQHGSILLNQGQSIMPDLLCQSTKLDRHANLFEVLGRQVSLPELQESVKKGFESAFDMHLDEAPLSDWEMLLASKLRSNFVISEGRVALGEPVGLA